MLEQINNFILVKWALRHPRIAAWIVLSVGMVALLIFEASGVGLQPGNWIALIIATVLVAGACIWIVSWDDGDETQPSPDIKTKTDEVPVVKVDEVNKSE